MLSQAVPPVPSSATSSVCNWLYSGVKKTSAIFAVSTGIYLGSKYYITTTNKILVEQLPALNNSVTRGFINAFGVVGTSLQYIGQLASLVNAVSRLINDPSPASQSLGKKILQRIITLGLAGCAGLGAYTLARIQAQEYEFEYDPIWLGLAIPLFLAGRDSIEAILGGLNTQEIKKLFAYVSQKNSTNTSLATSGINATATSPVNANDFPSLTITRGLTLVGSAVIVFSLVTVVDELWRNLLAEDPASANKIIQFVASALGNILQTLLDLEKLSELLQNIHQQKISGTLGIASAVLATAASSSSFMMAFEFRGIGEINQGAGIFLGILATLPKIPTAMAFIYLAVEYLSRATYNAFKEIKEFCTEKCFNNDLARTRLLPPSNLDPYSL